MRSKRTTVGLARFIFDIIFIVLPTDKIEISQMLAHLISQKCLEDYTQWNSELVIIFTFIITVKVI